MIASTRWTWKILVANCQLKVTIEGVEFIPGLKVQGSPENDCCQWQWEVCQQPKQVSSLHCSLSILYGTDRENLINNQ